MATTSRALALLDLLQTNRHWAGADLSRRLGVTPRTLRRDVELLRELGYRITTTRGVGGGYRLEAGESVPPLLLTADEAVTTALGLRTAVAHGLVDGAHVTLTALAKMERLLPSHLRRRVRALSRHVHSLPAMQAAVSPELLGRLALACQDDERLRFRYTAADGSRSDRHVQPHAIVSARRRWFLVAWDADRDAWRTFRVDRMSRTATTGVRGARRTLPAADAAEFVDATVTTSRRGDTRLDAIVDLPLARFRHDLGPWSREASAEGPDRTRWPLPTDSAASVLAALVWLPEGAGYVLDGDPELRSRVASAVRHLVAGTSPAEPDTPVTGAGGGPPQPAAHMAATAPAHSS